ncbi:hypothetical protein J4711_13540, partial [Staphylococcus epidermidis]|nr:hypothetical protein [Staphylococcus epidermidis]
MRHDRQRVEAELSNEQSQCHLGIAGHGLEVPTRLQCVGIVHQCRMPTAEELLPMVCTWPRQLMSRQPNLSRERSQALDLGLAGDTNWKLNAYHYRIRAISTAQRWMPEGLQLLQYTRAMRSLRAGKP